MKFWVILLVNYYREFEWPEINLFIHTRLKYTFDD